MFWRNEKYWELLSGPAYTEAASELINLADQVYNAVVKSDVDKLYALAKEFHGLDSSYQGVGILDTEPRSAMSDVVVFSWEVSFAQCKLNKDQILQIAAWFRWWPPYEPQVIETLKEDIKLNLEAEQC